MDYCIPKCVGISELRGADSFATALREALVASVLANWPELRKQLEPSRAARVAQLAGQIEELEPGLPKRLDEWMADPIRRRQTTGVEPLLRSLEPVAKLFWDLVYWKYSIDHRGRGNGVSQAMLQRLISGRSPVIEATFEPIVCAWPCPNCGSQATVSTHALATPPERFRHGLKLTCKACGHFEQHTDQVEDASVLSCACQHCQARRNEMAQKWRQMSENLWTTLANDIADKTRCAIEAFSVDGEDRLGPDAMRFTRMLWSRPDKTLGEMVYMYHQETSRNTFAHPFDVSRTFWKIAPALVEAGVLEGSYKLRASLDDRQAIIEAALHSRDRLYRDESVASLRMAKATTTAMIGPVSSEPAVLAAWVKAADEAGLVDSWIELPCDFWFSVNTDRVRELCGQSERDSESDIFLYRCVNSFERLQESSAAHIAELREKLSAGPLLGEDPSGLLQNVREVVAPAIVARTLSQIEREHSFLLPLLDDIEAAIRSNSDLEKAVPAEANLRRPAGKALANYCYWKLCREAVGEETGVALAWVMRIFGCQAVQFRKLLEKGSAQISCPQCAALADVSRISLGHPHTIATATLHCRSCGHVEQFGAEGENQLSCPCSRCKDTRAAALVQARVAATGIVERVVNVYLSHMDIQPKHASYFGFDGPMAPSEALMGYAQLRSAGHSPERSASLLFSGAIYLGKNEPWSPAWVTAFVKAGVFNQGPIERLEGEAAREFIRRALYLRLREWGTRQRGELATVPKSLAEVEAALGSGDPVRFAQGVRWLGVMMGGEVALPMRRRCKEVSKQLLELADEARARDLEPAHIGKGKWRDEPRPEAGFFAVPTWPSETASPLPKRPEFEAARQNAAGNSPKSSEYLAGVDEACSAAEAGIEARNPHQLATAGYDAFEAGRTAFEVALRGLSSQRRHPITPAENPARRNLH